MVDEGTLSRLRQTALGSALSRSSGRGRLEAASGASLVLTRRAVLDARVRTIAFAYLFAVYAYIQPSGYRSAYPKRAYGQPVRAPTAIEKPEPRSVQPDRRAHESTCSQ